MSGNMELLRYGMAELAKEELDRAIDQHGRLHSDHEAYALMKEEAEESQTAIAKMFGELSEFWEYVKKDKPISPEDIYLQAVDLACEAIQVAALALKTQLFHEEARTK